MTDPRAHFDEVLVQQLRDVWADTGTTVLDSAAREYDVSGWVNGEFDNHLEFLGHDGTAYRAVITASTVEDRPRRVLCTLRIQDAANVLVESAAALGRESR